MNHDCLQPLDSHHWQGIGLIASDMDGTLTQAEKFEAQLLTVLDKLAEKEIDVVITTGRSAGWVQAIVNYLPIAGAIAENGGLWFAKDQNQPQLIEALDIPIYRQKLQQIFEIIQSNFPKIQESTDNRFRLTDWTFDVRELTTVELEKIHNICQSEGYSFTYSSVQGHIKSQQQNKANGLEKIIGQHYSSLKKEQIVTIGDSPNDESMFNPERFPLSVGVANIQEYRQQIKYLPTFVAHQPELAGFCELATLIING